MSDCDEREIVKKGLELYGSKWSLARKLGYFSRHGGGSQINRVLKGEAHLPKWRIERLKILLEREGRS